MKPRTKESGRHVGAVLKALDLLDSFQTQPTLSLKELIDLSGLNRSRVMRLAGTLEARGYLSLEPVTGHYRLGSRLLTLGKLFELNNTFISLARPALKRLVQKTGESATLYAIDGYERVALAREHGTHEVRFSVTEGGRSELYAGAAGKVLLAHAPPEVAAGVLKAGVMRRLTPGTVVDPTRLTAQLKTIHRQGWAFSKGDRVTDAWGVAAPVFGHDGRARAAIGVAGPINRLTQQMRTQTVEAVTEVAQDLSRDLGWSPASAA
ncbi:MAG: IclR family transcriptional regulator [Rhodospirillales bacterium]|jgi:DNA-binding IclR family transcriptional regulator|nr:IclR family transcriptional regulator [Rhodospirillales bacterium]MDP7651364.1 IclR family transcriptional regulator [Rhodospirillales bacterium]HJO97643.1 IclR family transcriptional regulator [Rhodospirillales bacterium]